MLELDLLRSTCLKNKYGHEEESDDKYNGEDHHLVAHNGIVLFVRIKIVRHNGSTLAIRGYVRRYSPSRPEPTIFGCLKGAHEFGS